MRKRPQFLAIGALLLCFFCFTPQYVSGQKDNTVRIEFYQKELNTVLKPSDKIPILSEAIEEFTEKEDQEALAVFYREKGKVYRNIGVIDSSLVAYEYALNISRSLSDTTGLKKVLLSLGGIEAQNDRYIKAEKHIQELINILQSQGDSTRLASSLNTLGVIHQYKGDLRKAERVLKHELC